MERSAPMCGYSQRRKVRSPGQPMPLKVPKPSPSMDGADHLAGRKKARKEEAKAREKERAREKGKARAPLTLMWECGTIEAQVQECVPEEEG